MDKNINNTAFKAFLAKILKEVRIKNNLSRKALADVINISVARVEAYERGKKVPPLLLFLQIAKVFNMYTEIFELLEFCEKKENIQ